MTTIELLKILNRTKTSQRWHTITNPTPLPIPKLEIIDWIERKKMKNRLFIKYLSILGGAFLSMMILFVLPMILTHPPYGKGFLLGLPPMVFIALTWMLGAWWAWDKDRMLFVAVTFGAMPLRFAVGLSWTWMVFGISDVSKSAFIFSMMAYWALFTSAEIAMIFEMNKKIKTTIQLEPNDGSH